MNQEKLSISFKSEQHRQIQMKIDIFFGALIVLVVTIGMGLVGYVISDEQFVMGVVASAMTVGLLSLGVFCASRDRFLPVFGAVSTVVFVWAIYVIVTRGHSWVPYFLTFNAEAALVSGGRLYTNMLAKWRQSSEQGDAAGGSLQSAENGQISNRASSSGGGHSTPHQPQLQPAVMQVSEEQGHRERQRKEWVAASRCGTCGAKLVAWERTVLGNACKRHW